MQNYSTDEIISKIQNYQCLAKSLRSHSYDFSRWEYFLTQLEHPEQKIPTIKEHLLSAMNDKLADFLEQGANLADSYDNHPLLIAYETQQQEESSEAVIIMRNI